jgi:phosphoglycolate phosphatase-like HAD superfamily hydrolase
MLIGSLPDFELIIFDIDETLIDTSRSFLAAARLAVEERGGHLSDVDIAVFKAHGGYNDDWEMARAAVRIGRYRDRTGDRRPLSHLLTLPPVPRDDCGPLAARCDVLYAGLRDREVPLCDLALLAALERGPIPVAICTGRTRPQTAAAQRMLGTSISQVTTSDDVCKPDPRALTRLMCGRPALFVGDSAADQATAEAVTGAAPVHFARCLPRDATPAAARQAVAAGARVATSGPNPLLREVLDA